MSQRAEKLAERLRIFNTQVVTFVENCTQENWHKICGREDWTIGVADLRIILFFGISEFKSDDTCNPILYDLNFDNDSFKASLSVSNERFTFWRLSYLPVNVKLRESPRQRREGYP